jgi:hypothetical protein
MKIVTPPFVSLSFQRASRLNTLFVSLLVNPMRIVLREPLVVMPEFADYRMQLLVKTKQTALLVRDLQVPASVSLSQKQES